MVKTAYHLGMDCVERKGGSQAGYSGENSKV